MERTITDVDKNLPGNFGHGVDVDLVRVRSEMLAKRANVDVRTLKFFKTSLIFL